MLAPGAEKRSTLGESNVVINEGQLYLELWQAYLVMAYST